MGSTLYLVSGLPEVLFCMTAETLSGARPEHRILVLYGAQISIHPKLKEEFFRHVTLFGNWDVVIDATVVERPQQDYELKQVENIVRQTRDYDVDCIFTNQLTRLTERLIFDAYPRASIEFIDNGLASHVDQRIGMAQPSDRSHFVRPQDLERVKHFTFHLGDMLPIPNYADGGTLIVPAKDDILASIARVIHRGLPGDPKLEALKQERDIVLFFGTSFYRRREVKLAKEWKVYRKGVAEQCGLGRAVVLKDHPRLDDFDRRELDASAVHVDTMLPAEVIFRDINVTETRSVSSSGLLMMYKLYGARPHLIGTKIVRRIPLDWMPMLRDAIARIDEAEQGSSRGVPLSRDAVESDVGPVAK